MSNSNSEELREQVSNCHNATVTLGGDDEEGTHYYVCSECNKACDLAVRPQSEDWLDERTCRKCGLSKPLTDFQKDKALLSGYRYRCKPCANKTVRAAYEKNPRRHLDRAEAYRKRNWERIKQLTYKRRDPLKQKARQAVNNAVASGKFEKIACECGNSNTDFHHTNGYDEPNWFTGVWLCRKHHALLHKSQRRLHDAD